MKNNNEIDLMELLLLIKKNIWRILICGVICALVTGLVTSFFVEQKYTSSMKLVVLNTSDDALKVSDVQMSTLLIGDCIEIIKSRDLMENIKDSLNIDDLSANELAKNIDVVSPAGTRVLVVEVTDTNAVRAMRIANTIFEKGGDYIRNSLDVDDINVIEQPVVPQSPSSPNVQRNTILGGLAGIVLMIAFAVIQRLTNNKFTTINEIESELGITVLASIPKSGVYTKKKKHRHAIPNAYGHHNNQGRDK